MEQGFADLSESLGHALELSQNAVEICDRDPDAQGDPAALLKLCAQVITCCRGADAKAHELLAILSR